MTHQRTHHPQRTVILASLLLAASVLPALAQEAPGITRSLEARQLASDYLAAIECGNSPGVQPSEDMAAQVSLERLPSGARTVSNAPPPAVESKAMSAAPRSPEEEQVRVQGGIRKEEETSQKADAFPDATDK